MQCLMNLLDLSCKVDSFIYNIRHVYTQSNITFIIRLQSNYTIEAQDYYTNEA